MASAKGRSRKESLGSSLWLGVPEFEGPVVAGGPFTEIVDPPALVSCKVGSRVKEGVSGPTEALVVLVSVVEVILLMGIWVHKQEEY